MSPLAALWLVSLVGAALFLAAGYCAAVLRATNAGAAYALDDAQVIPPVTPSADDDRIADLIRERDATRGELVAVRHDLDAKSREAAAAQAVGHAAARQLAEAEAKIRDREPDARRREGEAAAKAENEARALAARVTDLTRRLAEADRRAEGIPALRDADEERRGLVVRVGVLEGRLRDAEHLREENARLRAGMRDRGLLEERLRAAEAQLSSPGDRGSHLSPLDRPLTPAAVDGGRRDELRGHLAALSKHASVRAALFADDLGFPVEAAGDHADALAALSGVLSGAATKARQILPLGPALRITVVDDRGVTVTAHRRATAYGPLALVTLTEGPPPEIEGAPHA